MSIEKPAPSKYPLEENIAKRWSPRTFADRAVESETLGSLLEAARWAPSSSNEQPWYFLVATKRDPAAFAGMLETLVPINQRWAANADVLLISVARLNWARTGQPNRHAFHDCGLALANLLTQATSMGLASHAMAGFSPEKARELFEVPEGYEPLTAIAIGYPGDLDALPPDQRDREIAPRKRKELSEFVFEGSWGRAVEGI